jgi:hypothetical protein
MTIFTKVKVMDKVKSVSKKAKTQYKKAAAAAFAFGIASYSTLASAAPATGNTDVDTILTTMESGFGTAKTAFVYLAIAAVPITLIVVLFFWLRGKFKQSVSGA